MNLSIGIAISSSLQIGLLVTPVLVLAGWAINQPMTLFFEDFETIILFASVLIVNYLIQDGRSNWLEGVLLLVNNLRVICLYLTNASWIVFLCHYWLCILSVPINNNKKNKFFYLCISCIQGTLIYYAFKDHFQWLHLV
jgi:hypothetical protein